MVSTVWKNNGLYSRMLGSSMSEVTAAVVMLLLLQMGPRVEKQVSLQMVLHMEMSLRQILRVRMLLPLQVILGVEMLLPLQLDMILPLQLSLPVPPEAQHERATLCNGWMVDEWSYQRRHSPIQRTVHKTP